MKTIAFITTGYFPVPAVEGGAVESLVTALIEQNEKRKKFRFIIYSSWSEDAERVVSDYEYAEVLFVRPPALIKAIDKVIFIIVSKLFKKSKSLSYRYIFQRLWFSFKVGWDLRKQKFDRLILENTPSTFLPLRMFKNKNRFRGKWIYHLHNEVGHDLGCNYVISRSRAVIGVSNYINQKFIERIPKFAGKSYVLKNCVTTSGVSDLINLDIRKKWGVNSDDFLILFAGRLSPEKGVLELIQAVEMIDVPKLTLMIVGGYYFNSSIHSDYEKKLKTEATKVSSKVIFTGYVDRQQLDAYYSACNVAVFPAIWEEPAGLTIIEAMQKGIPVITTRSGGIPEYVGENAAFMLNRDNKFVANLSKSILKMYSDPQFRMNLGFSGKQRASGYTAERYYTDFEQIIEKDALQ